MIVFAVFFQKAVTTRDNRSINVILWDTADQENYHSLAPIDYKDAEAALLVFSVRDSASFDRMVQWPNEVISARGPDIRLVVVGNKADLKHRVVPRERGAAFASENSAEYFEVSAKKWARSRFPLLPPRGDPLNDSRRRKSSIKAHQEGRHPGHRT
jgi:small GTP-binding protein